MPAHRQAELLARTRWCRGHAARWVPAGWSKGRSCRQSGRLLGSKPARSGGNDGIDVVADRPDLLDDANLINYLCRSQQKSLQTLN